MKYFTAHIKPSSNFDPRAADKQNAYLKALIEHNKENPLEIVKGNFQKRSAYRLLIDDSICTQKHICFPREGYVKVREFNEKKSDVNLVVNALQDAWQGSCEQVVIIANDSDFVPLIHKLKEDCSPAKPVIRVGLITPGLARKTNELKKLCDWHKSIREKVLRDSQLPKTVGKLYKPSDW